MTRTDVLVVGAGPVGVLNALGLAKAGLSVRVLEAQPGVVRSPRAMVYHWAVLDGLERLGVLDDAERAGFTKQEYDYYVFATRERISLNLNVLDGLVAHPYNVHLGQDRLADIALAHLDRTGAAEVAFDTHVSGVTQHDDGVTVRAETPDGTREFSAGWVIAADGAGSGVRKALGLGFDGMTWPEGFVATNVRYDFEAHGYARSTLQVDPRYGAIIAKIDNTNLWRVTYCEGPGLDEAGILDRMPSFFDAILPGDKDYELVQYSPYRMHQRAANTMRAGRVLLAGDAAHATNPIGGLGLTSGLFDTFVLYDALAAVIRGTAPDEVLDRYAEQRLRTFLELASPMAGKNKEFLYHTADPEQLESLRETAKDEQLQIERLKAPARLSTPALV
ncbi:monooxygenase [Amycolatopsis acidicola]|uniref:Monooxygenase n=1 Tax=Amycolatopsis acidicola TaxID=2596893 RepID=A0A5N0V636_9PSEU|nr:FAD-dependent monooxygenase [Amycolatopsis acidicola]KAA9160898.1 monooxygenase [Amycolatopsis acidicola]